MNEDINKLPFFINTRRLQREDSYFDIERSQEKLRRFLIERRNAFSSGAATRIPDWQDEYGMVGIYGVSRYINLEEDDDEEDANAAGGQLTEIDEDLQFDKTSGFQLFWMTFKRIAAALGDRFRISKPLRRPAVDVESMPSLSSQDFRSNDELCKIIIEPTHSAFRDPRVNHEIIVYGDVNYLIQMFRMGMKCGSLDVALFSVELPRESRVDSVCTTDLQAFVVSPECGSYVWIENGRASAIFMTKSSVDFFGSVMEWFRKILSDMVLADSVMIGHPYYWQPTIRRRLTRVMKYLKRLYRTLARRERKRLDSLKSSNNALRTDRIETVRPTEISKIVISEQPSRNLMHTNSTYEKLNIMLEQLVQKWFDYHQNLTKSSSVNVQDISKTYTLLNPQLSKSEEVLESVTFLDFYPQLRRYDSLQRLSRTSLPIAGTSSSARNESCSTENFIRVSSAPPDINNNIRPSRTKRHRSRDFNNNYILTDEGDTYPPHRHAREVYEASKCEIVDSDSDMSAE